MGDSAANSPEQLEPEKAFILKFKTLPVLWDSTNPHYTNKYKRLEALTKLLPYLKKSRPDATTSDVRKKINSLRSNYRRELRKIIMSKNGHIDEVYCPRGWAFRYLKFLGTLEEPGQQTQENETHNDPSDAESEEINIPEEPTEVKEETSETSFSFVSISPPPPSPTPPPPKIKRVNLETQSHPLHNYEYSQSSRPQDCNPMVLEWVNTLERLDPMQRLYAKKAINDVLFEAELGNLTRYSVKINDPDDHANSLSSPHSSTFN